jgi:signal transduction histidine kinase
MDAWADRLADHPELLEPADGGPSVLDGRTPVLLVPLRAQSRVIGVLAAARVRGREPFARTDVQMVRAFAAQAALTVEFGRAADDRQRLAVLEDRSRIAEDLHDLVIQRIFAVGMGLQGLSGRVDPPPAREQLSGFIDDLDATIRAIRQTIFSLQQAGPAAPGLRAEVLRVVQEAGPSLGFEPELVLDGPLDSVVPVAAVPEVCAVLREALSNVARHAGATGATVRVAVDTAAWTLTLTVQDDGVGPGPGDAPGLGTSTMQARARRLGGTCLLEPVGAPGRSGTRLVWRVSLDPAP